MVLNEAYEYQSFLSNIMEDIDMYLIRKENLVQTVEIHRRNAVYAEHEDETKMVKDRTWSDGSIKPMDWVDLMMDMLREKEAVSEAIAKVKHDAYIDIDTNMQVNKARQRVISMLKCMIGVKASSGVTKGQGYKFDNEGKQVNYVYDIDWVKSIDFDRNHIRKLMQKLSKESRAVSNEIERVNVTMELDFEPKYSIGDSVDDCMEIFKG